MSPQQNASVTLLRRKITEAKMTKKSFAAATGVSPEYLSRILNHKVRFPRVRETLESFAEVFGMDPNEFEEYATLQSNLPESTRKLWAKMKELDVSRSAFYARLKIKISRPYIYEILRGDLPFPKNPVLIKEIATAVEMEPSEFEEYSASRYSRRQRETEEEIERSFLNLLIKRMLTERGYSTGSLPFANLPPAMMDIFPLESEYTPEFLLVLQRMGEMHLNIQDLAKLTGVTEKDLRAVCFGLATAEESDTVTKQILTVLT